jgi:nucleoid DNA-binding protein
MKVANLVNNIRSYLWRYKRIALPGIGTFTMEHTPASIDKSDNLIHPPSSNLSFQYNSNTDYDGFVDYLSIIEDISRNEAKLNFDTYIDKIKSSISKNGEYSVPYLGKLISESTGNIRFEEENANYTEFSNLETYPILPVQKFGSLDNFNFNQPVKTTHSNRNEWWFYWLPFVLLGLMALASLLYFLKDSKDTVSYEDHYIQHQKGDNIIANDNSDTITYAEGAGDIVNEITNENDLSKTNEGEEDKVDKQSIRNCIIIVGSYKQAKSSLKMINKLHEMNYDVYTEQHNDFTRVGISFDCTNEDLTNYIRKIRSEIAKDAWYLQPSITVN